jgi:hypothetical protein
MGNRRRAKRVLGGGGDVRERLGKPKHRWEGDIKMDRQEVGWRGMDWIDLA